MATPTPLQTRLKELSHTLGNIQPLIDQLRSFTPSADKGDEARVELGSEIHTSLKDAEDELELLRIDVEALGGISDNKRKAPITSGEKESEKERVIALAERLATELKKLVNFIIFHSTYHTNSSDRTRSEFRNAQLQAKRQAELAKRKERELLLSRSQPSERQRPTEKLTQNDLVLNASNDVTSALRRTHHLMQAELSRSQFAQETLGKKNSWSSHKTMVH